MLLHDDPGRLEGLFDDFDRRVRIGVAAHEGVERHVARLRPAANADMAFSEHRHARNATVLGKSVQMRVKRVRARHIHAPPQRLFDELEIVKPPSAVQIHDEMGARTSNPIAFYEHVVLQVVR
jgi:hypothetical protein